MNGSNAKVGKSANTKDSTVPLNKICPINLAIGRRLSRESARLNLTGTETARIMERSRRTVCYYEQGTGCPDAQALGLLDQAGFDVLFIVTGRRSK